MAAKIKIEIEGTAFEIREAFEEFLRDTKSLKVEHELPPVVLEAIEARCADCGKPLTHIQVLKGGQYCSRSCATRHTAKARKQTMIKKYDTHVPQEAHRQQVAAAAPKKGFSLHLEAGRGVVKGSTANPAC